MKNYSRIIARILLGAFIMQPLSVVAMSPVAKQQLVRAIDGKLAIPDATFTLADYNEAKNSINKLPSVERQLKAQKTAELELKWLRSQGARGVPVVPGTGGGQPAQPGTGGGDIPAQPQPIPVVPPVQPGQPVPVVPQPAGQGVIVPDQENVPRYLRDTLIAAGIAALFEGVRRAITNRNDLDGNAVDRQNIINGLQQRINLLEGQLQAARANNAQLDALQKQTQADLDNARRELQNAQDLIAGLNRAIENAQAQLRQRDGRVADIERQLQQLQAQTGQDQERIRLQTAQLQAARQQARQEIADLTEVERILRAAQDNLRAQIRDLEANIITLRQSIPLIQAFENLNKAVSQSEVDRLKKDIADQAIKFQNLLDEQYKEHQQAILKMTVSLGDLQKQLQSTTLDRNQLRVRAEELQDAFSNLNKELIAVKNALEMEKTNWMKKQLKSNEIQTEYNSLEQEISKLTKDFNEAKNQLANSEAKQQEIKDNAKKAVEQYNKLKAILERQKELGNKQQKLLLE